MLPSLPKLPNTTLVIVAALALSGCAASSGSQHGDSGSPGKRDRRGKESTEKLTPAAEIARLRIERDHLAQANELLEEELAEAQDDLRSVERQFAIYEEHMASDQGKAAAVAASAEARIRFDRVVREQPNLMSDSTRAYVRELIRTSEALIPKHNYTAAQFFAERAHHTMSSAERRARLEGAATTRVVAADVANVREGPGQSYPVVGRVPGGVALLCWGEANDWFHVRTPDGVEGWVHVSLVR